MTKQSFTLLATLAAAGFALAPSVARAAIASGYVCSATFDPRAGTYGTYGGYNSGSYSEWKRWHDQQCRDLARQRPLDLRWQAQVRAQCAAEDRQARASYGV